MIENLCSLRQKIDEYDTQLLDIIQKRWQIVERIGHYKQQHDLLHDNDSHLRPFREYILLKSLEKHCEHPQDYRHIIAIWQVIMNSSIAKQKKLSAFCAQPTQPIPILEETLNFLQTIEYITMNDSNVEHYLRTPRHHIAILPIASYPFYKSMLDKWFLLRLLPFHDIQTSPCFFVFGLNETDHHDASSKQYILSPSPTLKNYGTILWEVSHIIGFLPDDDHEFQHHIKQQNINIIGVVPPPLH